MNQNTIECPKCRNTISLTEAISKEIIEKYRKEFKEQMDIKNQEIEKIKITLNKEKNDLIRKSNNIESEILDRLQKERTNLLQKLRHDIESEKNIEVQYLHSQLSEKSKQVDILRKNELNLRIKTSEIEDREKSLELEFQRKLDVSKQILVDEVSKKLNEENRLRNAEKDKQLDELRRQIDDLRRKADQGSQQTQGEVLEHEIESSLKLLFPNDSIEPVSNGINGGDIIHRVTNSSGKIIGTILWETKQTQKWNDNWIDKLKNDQRSISAEIGVIVTRHMPKGISRLGLVDGIWVTDFSTFSGTAIALRSGLIDLFHAKIITSGKDEKLDYVYKYLIGTQFKHRIETVVESFQAMQSDLDKEKRLIQKVWSKREQHLARVISSTVGLYGDIQGIVGSSLPIIHQLEIINENVEH